MSSTVPVVPVLYNGTVCCARVFIRYTGTGIPCIIIIKSASLAPIIFCSLTVSAQHVTVRTGTLTVSAQHVPVQVPYRYRSTGTVHNYLLCTHVYTNIRTCTHTLVPLRSLDMLLRFPQHSLTVITTICPLLCTLRTVPVFAAIFLTL